MSGAPNTALWPVSYDSPADLADIEAVPLDARALPASTYAVLRSAAELWPERPALTVLPCAARWREGSTRTFTQLRDDVHRLAHLFRAQGAGRGRAVGLLTPNTADLPAALLAAQAVGIAVPVNPGLPAEQIGRLLALGGARILVAAGPELDEQVWLKARMVASRLGLTALFALRPTGAHHAAPALEPLAGIEVAYLGVAAASQRSSPPETLPDAGDIAALFHTGGTTGLPKLAAHSHANEVIDAWSVAANTLLDERSVLFAALPLFHVNALVVTLLGPLLRGQHVVWAGPLGYREPELYSAFWKVVEHYRIATLSAVPTVYSVLAQCPVDADIGSLRFAVVGASALPPAVRDSFTRHTGVELCEGYGLTEATCASARGFLGAGHRPGAVGQRLPYQRAKTVRVDDDGTWHDLPPGEVGVLALRGPTVFPGYVTGQGPAGPVLDGLGAVRDGWLDTGDLARVDADGFIHLTGRAKDLIIRGGHNIDPAVIEDALLQHPQVSSASAVGRPDRHAGEVPVAYVTLVAGASVSPAELSACCRQLIHEPAAVPKDITIVETLPLTDVGKPTKVPLRLRALQDVVLAELATAEVPADAGEVDCVLADDRLTVRVPYAADPSARARIAAVLDRYAFHWEFTPAGAPTA
ncbi:acyl-CoA synthetase [Streptomyces sp. NPDC006422]|uniref:acyl-CoA synthetase n=1 Tax=unclassified Streptomyces TaxID=2593676 RepID=UPI0033A0CE83